MKAGSSQYSQFCSSKDMCLLFGDMIFIPNMNSNILKTPESLWEIISPKSIDTTLFALFTYIAMSADFSKREVASYYGGRQVLNKG